MTAFANSASLKQCNAAIASTAKIPKASLVFLIWCMKVSYWTTKILSMISLCSNRHHFLHGRRRLWRGACVSTWDSSNPSRPAEWLININNIKPLVQEVFLLWMLLNVDEAENIWFWVAWEEFVEVPEYKSLRCMKKRHCLSVASLAFHLLLKGIYSWYFWILELLIPDFSCII